MNIIKRNLASVLISMVASIVTAQTVTSFSFEPAVLSAEEIQAVERVINSTAPEDLHLRPAEADLFLQLLNNGNRMIAFGIAEDGHFGLCYGTNVEAYIIREDNGFSILYKIENEEGDQARSASAKVSIRPPHAVLNADEVKLLKERLTTVAFASEVDSLAFVELLDNGNHDTFGIGFADDDMLGILPVQYGSYADTYIIRTADNGVALYYEVYDQNDQLKAIRQTSPISLK